MKVHRTRIKKLPFLREEYIDGLNRANEVIMRMKITCPNCGEHLYGLNLHIPKLNFKPLTVLICKACKGKFYFEKPLSKANSVGG